MRKLLPVAGLLLGTSLGCGLLGDEPPPPEPLPLVLPSWLSGEWTGMVQQDGRLVAWLPCDQGPELLSVGQGGAVRWRRGDETVLEDMATDVQLASDLSVTLPLRGGGSLVFTDEDGVMLVSGDRPGGSDARRFVQLSGPGSVEVVVEPAGACGASPDVSPLGTLVGPYNSSGDPCAAAGLLVVPDGPVPTLTRAGADYRIQAVRTRWDGLLLTLERGGKLHGIWIEPQADGTVRVWQQGPGGMASETLRSAAGVCQGEATHQPRGAGGTRLKGQLKRRRGR